MSRFNTRSVLAVAFVLALPLAMPVSAQKQILADRPVTMETLLDRIQIEDMLVRYYYDLAMGTIANGRAEIEKLYGGGRARDPNAAPRPRNGMLLTNPVIEVKGNRAQAHVIWTGITNKGVGQPPALYEQGREDTELVKVDGKWLISKRYISSDSGTPDRFDQTFKQRDNPLPPL